MSNKKESLFVFPEHPMTGVLYAPRYFEDRRWTFRSTLIWTGVLLLGLLFVAAVGNVLTAGLFTSGRNLVNLANQSLAYLLFLPFLAILASRGGFDFSVGYLAGFAGILCLQLINGGTPWAVACLVSAAAAGLFGAVNGFFVGVVRLNGFLVTMVMAVLVRGLNLGSLQATGTIQLRGSAEGAEALLWAVLVVLWGCAAWLSWRPKEAQTGWKGIAYRGGPYVLTALGAGFAGVAIMLRLQSAGPTIGFGFEFDCLLAVVAGGLWLSGNRPNVAGALIAGLSLVMLVNLFSLLLVDVAFVYVLKGTLILLDFLILWGYHALVGVFYRRQTR